MKPKVKKTIKKTKIRTTEKQKKFVEGKLNGKSSRRAALDAGYKQSVADNANTEILVKLGTQTYMNKLGQLLEDQGVTDLKLVKAIKKGLKAKGYYGKDAIEGDDYKTRLDYIKFASELKGHKVNDKVDINFTNNLFLNVRSEIDKEEHEGVNSEVEK